MNCRTCGTELIPGYKRDGGNWVPSLQKTGNYICRSCFSDLNKKSVPSTCGRCKETLVAGPEGNWNGRNDNGLCRTCRAEYNKNWQDNNHGYGPAKNKEWNTLNPERAKAFAKRGRTKRRIREQNAINLTTDTIDRRVVWGRDEGHCRLGIICNHDFVPFQDMHLDHIVPIAKGGTHTWNNVQTSCAPCNFIKGARSLKEVMPLCVPISSCNIKQSSSLSWVIQVFLVVSLVTRWEPA